MAMNRKTLRKKGVENVGVSEEKDSLFLDTTLRPSRWDDYVGQVNIKNNLRILLTAAKERRHPPEHILFYGPPGLGKTTLAHLISKEINTQMKVTSGPAIEKIGDLASILTNLTPGDILFIDEIHRLNKTIEEVLYPAMESGSLDIIIGKGPSARTIQLELPPFTLIGATTRIAMISSPLRSRFSGGIFKLEFYTNEEIQKIITRSANILSIDLEGDAAEEIAKRSRFTPRTANYFLKRCRDYAQVHKTSLTQKSVDEALKLLGIDKVGLSPADRDILHTIINKFSGGPVGLNTLAAAMSEEQATIEEFNEPYLIQSGFLDRTPRGRTVTVSGYEHLGLTPPNNGTLI
ncbi:MAG: Holliday junction ATP-dependent DNA helicase RuvB [Parcubacteria group bacterium GW2011_GWF2_40_69]|nr:MAG: Holliday junction ATP-dependent DNA helicase RuvB [Parcubacteria group bacterium GW2011_GWC1_39_12]KKR19485.1 MAG: Holliday junction ATP-dependent DNA helicase RuvB [Parcubacteria group bacterium GW2011_GWF1_39_37]KKR35111.1 MAG: Holliday junction ATP-dependent DNA helicase RuvB [Parcubacteria group bacterium GW2011_GWC2_40_10]KKR52434.1 MAG: Holliday junction ATP-dependent DNA helicase RuvB [Parcubacteria group bacterium GW2011_GWE1_40_20]KKR65891.1 MAG: Holliday junction ATP-dependent